VFPHRNEVNRREEFEESPAGEAVPVFRPA
jgi:hypothetical protein